MTRVGLVAFEYPTMPQGAPLAPQVEHDLCQQILAEIQSGLFQAVGHAPDNRSHWEEFWAKSSPIKVPAYVRPGEVLRVNQHFVQTKKRGQELHWYKLFRKALLQTYFYSVPAIYEFGCGNGWNLVAAHELYPAKKLVGLDWAQSAVDRINNGFGPYWSGLRIEARRFDFFDPDYSLDLERNNGVWTVGALEQTGTNWEPFLEYLLSNKPAICVHVEPILDWYDPKNPVDQTAIAYHFARNYWQGFPAKMRHLAAQGKVEILKQQRSWFGSKYLEGYSLLVWRPI